MHEKYRSVRSQFNELERAEHNSLEFLDRFLEGANYAPFQKLLKVS